MKQKKQIALFGMVAVALILAACDGDSGNNSSESEGDSSSSVEISSSSEQINSSSVVKSSSSSLVVSSSSAKGLSSSSVPLSSSVVNSSSSLSGISSSSSIEDGSLTYKGQTYKTVVIGTQTWMAKNLNYAVDSSWCYNDSTKYCEKYGRLYSWGSAMTACPEGWHLPSTDEWQTLDDYVDVNNGDEGVGTSLKSTSGWEAYSGVATGTDRFGFSALPAGGRGSNGIFYYAGNIALFWSATELNSDNVNIWNLVYSYEVFDSSDDYKPVGLSVRCLKDE